MMSPGKNFRHNLWLMLSLVPLMLSGVACGDDDTTSNGTGGEPDNSTVLISVSDLPETDTTCPMGGSLVETGRDNGDGTDGNSGDGILQPGEVDETRAVCNDPTPTPGVDQLALTTTLDAGDEDCPAGGTRLELGDDNGDGGGIAGDGTLQPGEVDSTEMFCLAGDDGDIVTREDVLGVGDDDCPNGGTRIIYGRDNGASGGTANDGILQDGEVQSSLVSCKDVDELADTLTSTEVIGVDDENCPFGGTRVDYGLDNGDGSGTADDMTLDSGEVDGSEYVCHDESSGLLVDVTELLHGDETCPAGGEVIQSGLDDGSDGGTADNGTLEPGEVVNATTICNLAVEDVFELTEGELGDLQIGLNGGEGDHGLGGPAGQFSVEIIAGPMPALIEMSTVGSYDMDVTVPEGPVDLGGNIFACEGNCSIRAWNGDGDPPAIDDGPYYDSSDGEDFHPVYLGDELISGLDVEAGARVTVGRSGASIHFASGIYNAGTIRSGQIEPGARGSLSIRCDTFHNAATGVVTTAGGSYSGPIVIDAVESEDAIFINEGVIKANGGDPNAGPAGSIWLRSARDFYNTGDIFSYGGRNPDSPASSGASVTIQALSGDIYHTGVINTRGGDNTGTAEYGGNGGDVTIRTRRDILDPYLLPQDLGPGGVYLLGPVFAHGTSAGPSEESGGAGGNITVEVAGGDLVVADELTTYGGDAGDNDAGEGGDIVLHAFIFYEGDLSAIAFPETVVLAGNMTASGGSVAGYGDGASAGDVSIFLGLATSKGDELIGGGVSLPSAFNESLFEDLGAQPLIVRMLGYLGGFDFPGVAARGGDSDDPRTARVPGAGGSATIAIRSCPEDDRREWGPPPLSDCTVLSSGPRWIYSDLYVDLRSGNAYGSGEGAEDGPTLAMTIDSGHGNASDMVLGETRIELHGPALMGGGYSSAGDGGEGGYASFHANAGDVILTSLLRVSGGGGDLDGGNQTGQSGRVDIVALRVFLEDRIVALGRHDGPQATLSVQALDAVIDGSVDLSGGVYSTTTDWDRRLASGGAASFSIARSLELNDEVNVNGARVTSTDEGFAGSGGSITAYAQFLTVVDEITADGGSVTAENRGYAGNGGSIEMWAEDLMVSEGGVISASGGGVDSGEGDTRTEGDGGTISLIAPTVQVAGVVRANGGVQDVTGTGTAYGGDAGTIAVTGDNSGSLFAQGGAATGGDSQAGGDGGDIFVSGDNSGCIDVSGSGGGADGTATVEGADTGSCD